MKKNNIVPKRTIIENYDYLSSPTPPPDALVHVNDVTKNAISDAAMAYLSKKQIMSLTRLSQRQLDDACLKAFSLNADDFISICRLKVHSAFVKRLSDLSIDGNNTAIKILSQIIGTSQQNNLADSGIKISLDISSLNNSDDPDDDNDGGFHVN